MPPPLPLPNAPTNVTTVAPRITPTVVSFDEQEYVCQKGDTFESVSKQFYMAAEYAKALQRHNASHPRVNEDMSNSGKLIPGEKIYIPQIQYLEQRYAGAIPRPPSSSNSGALPASFSPTNSTPLPAPTPPQMPPAR